MPEPVLPTPADLRRFGGLKRDDEFLWELGGDGPRAQAAWAAGRFAAEVFDGHAIAVGDVEGATAFADSLLGAMEGPGGMPSVRLDLFQSVDDLSLNEIRRDALDVLIVGAVALARAGHDLDQLAPDLLRFAGDPTPDALELRRILLGDQPFGPEPRIPPEFLLPIEEFLKKTCYVEVLDALRNVGAWVVKATTDADGITSLAPSSVCPGATFAIRGSGFGATRPAGTDVIVARAGGGWMIATVVSWSDTEIVVQAPADIGPGCVGFLRGSAPQGPLPENIVGVFEHCFGPSAGRWDKLDDPKFLVSGDAPPCLPGDINRLATAGAPVIQSFTANIALIEPGGSFQLTWSTLNATSVSITRASVAGPPVWLGTLSLSGTVTVGPFQGTTPVTGMYELVATNACGTARRTVSVGLRARANLSITGIEVVQSVQRPDNSIRLVARQRTAVRVFVDSGIRNGFDSGAGPNELAGLQVTVLARPMPTGFGVQCPGPWSLTVHAKPSPDRDTLSDSFTFDVPVASCTGTVRFEVSASISAGVRTIAPSTASSAVDVTFEPKQAQEVLPVLVTDTVNANPTPTFAEYLALLAGPRERHPFTDTGFLVNPPLSWSTGSGVDLRTGPGWNLMLGRLLLTIFLFPSTPVGGIRTAAVPNDGMYPWGGLALPRVGATVPGCLIRINNLETFAHEIGHTYGLLHVNCGGAAGPYGGLPLVTDQPGLDVRNRMLTRTGGSELMTYCPTQWVSTLHYDHMFNSVPIS